MRQYIFIIAILACSILQSEQSILGEMQAELQQNPNPNREQLYRTWTDSDSWRQYFHTTLDELETQKQNDIYRERLLEFLQTCIAKRRDSISQVDYNRLRRLCLELVKSSSFGVGHTSASILQWIYLSESFAQSCANFANLIEDTRNKAIHEAIWELLYDGLLNQWQEQIANIDNPADLQQLYDNAKKNMDLFREKSAYPEHRHKYWRLLFDNCSKCAELWRKQEQSHKATAILEDFVKFAPQREDLRGYHLAIKRQRDDTVVGPDTRNKLDQVNQNFLQFTLNGEIWDEKQRIALIRDYSEIADKTSKFIGIYKKEAEFHRMKLQQELDYFALSHNYLPIRKFSWYDNEADTVLLEMSRLEDKIDNLRDRAYQSKLLEIDIQEAQDSLALESSRAGLEIEREEEGQQVATLEEQVQRLQVLIQGFMVEIAQMRLLELASLKKQLDIQREIRQIQLEMAKGQEKIREYESRIAKLYEQMAVIDVDIQNKRIVLARKMIQSLKKQLRRLRKNHKRAFLGKILGTLASTASAYIANPVSAPFAFMSGVSGIAEMRGDSKMQKLSYRGQIIQAEGNLEIEERQLQKSEKYLASQKLRSDIAEIWQKIAKMSVQVAELELRDIDEKIAAWYIEKQKHQMYLATAQLERQQSELRKDASERRTFQAQLQHQVAQRRKLLVEYRQDWSRQKLLAIRQNKTNVELLLSQKQRLLSGYREMARKHLYLASKVFAMDTGQKYSWLALSDSDNLRFQLRNMRDEYNAWQQKYDGNRYQKRVKLSEQAIQSLIQGNPVFFTLSYQKTPLDLFIELLEQKILEDSELEREDFTQRLEEWQKIQFPNVSWIEQQWQKICNGQATMSSILAEARNKRIQFIHKVPQEFYNIRVYNVKIGVQMADYGDKNGRFERVLFSMSNSQWAQLPIVEGQKRLTKMYYQPQRTNTIRAFDLLSQGVELGQMDSPHDKLFSDLALPTTWTISLPNDEYTNADIDPKNLRGVEVIFDYKALTYNY